MNHQYGPLAQTERDLRDHIIDPDYNRAEPDDHDTDRSRHAAAVDWNCVALAHLSHISHASRELEQDRARIVIAEHAEVLRAILQNYTLAEKGQ